MSMMDPKSAASYAAFEAELRVFVPLATSETDRGCVLITAAVLDKALKDAIAAKLGSMSAGTEQEIKAILKGPLRDFYQRSLMGLALGLIDRTTYEALEAIREMRNKAAHLAEPVTFGMFDWAALLRTAENLTAPIEAPAQMTDDQRALAVRWGFVVAAVFLWYRLAASARDPNDGHAKALAAEAFVRDLMNQGASKAE